jgi:hypothetical protein
MYLIIQKSMSILWVWIEFWKIKIILKEYLNILLILLIIKKKNYKLKRSVYFL